jgi:hypothetical protein
MTYDEIADLADRLEAMTGFEFAIEWAALTDAERDEVMALLNERIAHGEERLEGITENVRALKALLVLVMSNGGGTVGEALVEGRVTLQEVVEAIRGAVPDPCRCRTDARPPAPHLREGGLRRGGGSGCGRSSRLRVAARVRSGGAMRWRFGARSADGGGRCGSR